MNYPTNYLYKVRILQKLRIYNTVPAKYIYIFMYTQSKCKSFDSLKNGFWNGCIIEIHEKCVL